MINSSLLAGVGILVISYLLHSTLLLSAAALATRGFPHSPRVRERLWKWGAIFPLITVPLQPLLPQSASRLDWNWPNTTIQNTTIQNTTSEIQPRATQSPQAGNATSAAIATVTPPTVLEGPYSTRPPAPALPETLPDPNAVWNIQIHPALEPEAGALATSILPGGLTVTHSDERDFGRAKETATSRPGTQIAVEPAFQLRPLAAPPAVAPWPLVLAGCIGLLFLVIGTGRMAWDVTLVRRELQRTQPATTGWVFNQLRQFCQQHHVRHKIELRMSCRCVEPAACGVWRWTILLPEGLCDQLQHEQVKALLAHELGHLVRRDTLWLWVGRWLTHCCPWQPLNFLAFQGWRAAEEFLADQWALERGIRPLTLARCLTDVAAWRMSGPPCSGVPATATSLTDRVTQLINETQRNDLWQQGWRRRLLTACLFLTGLVVAAFGPRIVWQRAQDLPTRETPHSNISSAPQATSVDSPALLDPAAPAQLLSGNVVTPNEHSVVADELARLTADLEVAVSLLATQSPDPEMAAVVQRIRARLAQLQTRSNFTTP